jgi:DNA-binding response OmpR family regulator
MSAGTNLDALARDIGADDSISKPFEVDDLVNVVNKWVA